jgi:hypothetical protein
MGRGDGRKASADRLIPPQTAKMSRYSVAEEITPVRADFLVERRGFEPMAIVGAGIRQVGNFHARADSLLHPRKSRAEQRRRVFFDNRHDAIADNVLPSGEPSDMGRAIGHFE